MKVFIDKAGDAVHTVVLTVIPESDAERQALDTAINASARVVSEDGDGDRAKGEVEIMLFPRVAP